MSKNVLIIQGHPDGESEHFGHGLANAYAMGAGEAGHKIERIEVAQLDFPLVRSQDDWHSEAVPADIRSAQNLISWADHLAIFYPLWLGTMPALFKGFLEQVLRPGFAMDVSETSSFPKKLLKDKSARIVVTMGMPSLFYRLFYQSHSVKNLERNILKFCGITPVKTTYIGGIESDSGHARWLDKIKDLGVGE
ncbi:MAG: NAD(P)H-dependent oxidoreductase [Pseudomonadota bacterium]